MTTGIMLAAGEATRFGDQKLLHHLGGSPLICRSVAACVSSRLDDILVVTAPDTAIEETLRVRFPVEERLRFIQNPNPSRGMMSSLKLGLEALYPETAAAMVMLADMPMIPAHLIDELVIAQAWNGGILIPQCESKWRHPRIIPRDLFPDFLDLGDDVKGTDIIERYRADITLVDVVDPNTFMDINEPADVAIWQSANEQG